mmetsp:Transcript_19682/g.41312  ORF Transcript_19682/g.41312 Transcript_19682/m.41312 type:complete len:122 (-) Transcript_19682:2937-3302(-)
MESNHAYGVKNYLQGDRGGTGGSVISFPTVGVDPNVGAPVTGALVAKVGSSVGIGGIRAIVGGVVSVTMENGDEVGMPVGLGVLSVGLSVSTGSLLSVGVGEGTGVLQTSSYGHDGELNVD